MRLHIIPVFILILTAIATSACGSVNKSGKYDVANYRPFTPEYQEDGIKAYLVPEESYTTNGADYQRKYEDYLTGIAKILIYECDMQVVQKSIGFYYDKRENKRDRLYLGVDIFAEAESSLGYEDNGREMIKKYMEKILSVMNSCDVILDEKEVQGAVIGVKWKSAFKEELINVWIDKSDIRRFYSDRLTFNELVMISTVTNSDGKIIRLTL